MLDRAVKFAKKADSYNKFFKSGAHASEKAEFAASAGKHVVTVPGAAKHMADATSHGPHGGTIPGKLERTEHMVAAAQGAGEAAEFSAEAAAATAKQMTGSAKVLGAASNGLGVANAATAAVRGGIGGYRTSSAQSEHGKVANGVAAGAVDGAIALNPILGAVDTIAGVVAPGHKPSDAIKEGLEGAVTSVDAVATGSLAGLNRYRDKMLSGNGVMNWLYSGSDYLAEQGWGSVYGDAGRNCRQVASATKSRVGQETGDVKRAVKQKAADVKAWGSEQGGDIKRAAKQTYADGKQRVTDETAEAWRTTKQKAGDVKQAGGDIFGDLDRTVRQKAADWRR